MHGVHTFCTQTRTRSVAAVAGTVNSGLSMGVTPSAPVETNTQVCVRARATAGV
jgi:hypothetical protein